MEFQITVEICTTEIPPSGGISGLYELGTVSLGYKFHRQVEFQYYGKIIHKQTIKFTGQLLVYVSVTVLGCDRNRLLNLVGKGRFVAQLPVPGLLPFF